MHSFAPGASRLSSADGGRGLVCCLFPLLAEGTPTWWGSDTPSQGFVSSSPWGTLGHLLKTPSSQVTVTVQRPVVSPNKNKKCWLLAVTILAILSVFPDLADLGAAVSAWSDDKEACSHAYMAAISDHAAGGLGDFRK